LHKIFVQVYSKTYQGHGDFDKFPKGEPMKQFARNLFLLLAISPALAYSSTIKCESENRQASFTLNEDNRGQMTMQLLKPVSATYKSPLLKVSVEGGDTVVFSIDALPTLEMQGRIWPASETDSVNGRVSFNIEGTVKTVNLICEFI